MNTEHTPGMTSADALARAFDWAEGKLSHWNEMLTAEASFDHRPQTLAAIAQADAFEAMKWAAIAQALLAGEAQR